MRYFHVSSVLNRESIQRHGLDPSRMGAAPGIAGSTRPEADGCFVTFFEAEAEFFVRMNNTGGPVDLWAVDEAADEVWVETDSGFSYLVGTVAVDRLTLIRRDLPPIDR
jgi:hypothetical protein